jgi:hypothetical protein
MEENNPKKMSGAPKISLLGRNGRGMFVREVTDLYPISFPRRREWLRGEAKKAGRSPLGGE